MPTTPALHRRSTSSSARTNLSSGLVAAAFSAFCVLAGCFIAPLPDEAPAGLSCSGHSDCGADLCVWDETEERSVCQETSLCEAFCLTNARCDPTRFSGGEGFLPDYRGETLDGCLAECAANDWSICETALQNYLRCQILVEPLECAEFLAYPYDPGATCEAEFETFFSCMIDIGRDDCGTMLDMCREGGDGRCDYAGAFPWDVNDCDGVPALDCLDQSQSEITCTSLDLGACACLGCSTDDLCTTDEDCTCSDCQTNSVCMTGCNGDGTCDPANETCNCNDCAGHPLCQ